MLNGHTSLTVILTLVLLRPYIKIAYWYSVVDSEPGGTAFESDIFPWCTHMQLHRKALTQRPPFLNVIVKKITIYAC